MTMCSYLTTTHAPLCIIAYVTDLTRWHWDSSVTSVSGLLFKSQYGTHAVVHRFVFFKTSEFRLDCQPIFPILARNIGASVHQTTTVHSSHHKHAVYPGSEKLAQLLLEN